MKEHQTMEHDFWNDAWEAGETGWQQEEVNPLLKQLWSTLQLPKGTTVFVPLCGASIDMIWLLQQGMKVVGAELNENAIKQFLVEHQLSTTVVQEEHSTVYRNEKIELYCGDIFQLQKSDLPEIDAIYDRAATIALPDELRLQYANHLCALTNPEVSMLLITFDYNQEEMPGPPFSVPEDEVKRIFGPNFSIEQLDKLSDHEVLAQVSPRGVTHIDEVAYQLKRK